MSDTLESLGRKINGAADLESVVRTMKVLAASNILQYEKAVNSLADYYRTVELGLVVCLRNTRELRISQKNNPNQKSTIDAVVFGSDQGLVGQFNDVLSEFVSSTLQNLSGKKKIWAIGERIQGRLEDSGFPIAGYFSVPNSVNTIAPLIGQILLESEAHHEKKEDSQLFIFHNQPKPGATYEPTVQQILPLDEKWHNHFLNIPWPTKKIPQTLNSAEITLHGLIRNYLFVSLFRACAESMASENASRLAAMQRAEKNIEELLDDLNRAYHRLRQSSIDEELFDVITGSEALQEEINKLIQPPKNNTKKN